MPTEQRQDSVEAQLRTVAAIAREVGCYDAADWIRAVGLPRAQPGLTRAQKAETRVAELEAALNEITVQTSERWTRNIARTALDKGSENTDG